MKEKHKICSFCQKDFEAEGIYVLMFNFYEFFCSFYCYVECVHLYNKYFNNNDE